MSGIVHEEEGTIVVKTDRHVSMYVCMYAVINGWTNAVSSN